MIVTSSAPTESTTRRVAGRNMSMKKATPRFSPRASALAAPKKLEPTISPRATSSDHSTGALNRKRSSTETHTTTRSAARRMAAIASLKRSRRVMLVCRPPESDAASVIATSSLGRADHIDDRLGLGPRLDEILRLGRHALTEGFPVAIDHRDALFGERCERFLLHRKPMRTAVGRGLPCRIQKAIAQLRIHAVEGHVTEIDRKRREIVLRQRIVLRGLVE